MQRPFVRDLVFYGSVVLILFGFFVSAYPTASIHAEPFAETGSRYFLEFHGPGDLSYFVHKDFGYFGIVPRTLYYILGSIFGPGAFPELIQTGAVLVIAMTMGIFVFSAFSPVIPSRLLRVMVVLLVASGHEYGMFLLHNLGYCFVFPVCYGLALFGVTQKHKNFMLLLSAAMIAFIWSKGYSVVTIPALLYGVFDRLKRKDYFFSACFAAVFLLSLPQFIAVFQARTNFNSTPSSPLTILSNAFYFYVYSWRHFSIGGQSGYDGAEYAFFSTLVALTLVWVRILTLRSEQGRFLRSSFIGSQLLAFGGVGLLTVTLASQPVKFFHFPTFESDSYFFCSQVSIVFGLGLFLSWYIQKVSFRSLQWVLLVAILVRGGVVRYTLSHVGGEFDPYAGKINSASDWDVYFPLFSNHELQSIPINPPGWFIGSAGKPVSEIGTVHLDTDTIALNKNVTPGIKGVCIFNLKHPIRHLEIQSKSGPFTAPSFRSEDTKHPCFEWPKDLSDLSEVVIGLPSSPTKDRVLADTQISFLY